MNWEDLRHFVVLAQTGSLSEAARHLGVDHTTVARRVAALETALKVRLVDRLPRAYLLTEDGERIAQLARGMDEQAHAVMRTASAADPSLVGCVRVSAPPVFASVVLAPGLGGLATDHPGLVVELAGESHTAALERREADIALRLLEPAGEGLVVRKLCELSYSLYAAPSYAQDRDPAEYRFVAYDSSLEQVPQQRWLMQVAGPRPVVFRSNDAASLASATRAGLGVAVLPDFLAHADPGLVRLAPPVGILPPSRPLWLVVHEDLRRSARVRLVMDFLIAMLSAPVFGGGAKR
ncbi:MAG: LysR family transcriptional regulator [Magnetospirillum sp.]